jgi:hypothetical protein
LFDGDRRRAFSFSGEVKISGVVADLLEEIKIPTSGKTGPEMGHPGSSLTNDRKSKSPPCRRKRDKGGAPRGNLFQIKTEEVMKRNLKSGEVRVELKYCERCGGLWVREGGGGVYCNNCEPEIADLPILKKGAGRLKLPVRTRSVVNEVGVDRPEQDVSDLEAAGGVA